MRDLPENELALRAQAGDEWAQQEIIETCTNKFCKPSSQYSWEETRQDARISTWHAIQRFRAGAGNFSHYAARYVKGAVLESQRAYAKTYARETPGAMNEDNEEAVESNVETTNLAERMRTIVLNRLTSDERIIFFERILLQEDGLGYRALGRRLDVSHEMARKMTMELEARLPRIFSELRDSL